MSIVLKPTQGLANRLRVMASGVGLSKALNQPLKIIWKKDAGLYCDFDDLFQCNKYLNIQENDWRVEIIDRVSSKKILFNVAKKIFGFEFVMYDRDIKEFVWKTGTNYLDLSRIKFPAKGVYISCCNEFFLKTENLQYFKPNVLIQSLIEENTNKFPPNIIGIHIRRTDHGASIKESSSDAFIKKMRNEVDKDSSISFYIATDDLIVKENISNEFGSRIYLFDNVLERNSKDGMIGAMVDLYSLAKTKRLFGSYMSSYSELASQIGDIPLEIVKG